MEALVLAALRRLGNLSGFMVAQYTIIDQKTTSPKFASNNLREVAA